MSLSSTNNFHTPSSMAKYTSLPLWPPLHASLQDMLLNMTSEDCMVLKRFLGQAEGEEKQLLIAEITENALLLSVHPIGNIIIQHLVGLRDRQITAGILAQLAGRYTSLSMTIYGCYVVQKCIVGADEDQAMQIINELFNDRNFSTVLQHSSGTYVAQTALQRWKNSTPKFIHIHSHPNGKRVLAPFE